MVKAEVLMNKRQKFSLFFSGLLFLLSSGVIADDVKILATEFRQMSDGSWSVDVTLEHADTGWEHYADHWRVVDAEGNVLGDRVLYHPHVDEQPFTRSLSAVKVPESIGTVYIEAHDKVHGWTENRLEVDLNDAVDGLLRVEAES